MANMSYCRFENTYNDLKDCYLNFDNCDLSETEEKYRQRILNLAQEIVNDFSEDIEED